MPTTTRTRSTCRPTWPRPWTCGGAAGSPAVSSATTWSTTTPTWPPSSWRPSGGRSPTGSATGGSSGCERACELTEQHSSAANAADERQRGGRVSSTCHDVVNPATEQIVATVPSADAADTDAAVARARRAYETWRTVAPADRG